MRGGEGLEEGREEAGECVVNDRRRGSTDCAGEVGEGG
eukprot:CAMPEP_0173452684 /NCGR_PEP_ID=MMETSP1357-20121228/49198_1 /TAXON_ID=77926 /ORGANISM="Hemiselmis rufescens, Strain PCC563" /LENGTH=37 /DNA_ID= /DNA_START= /DNA_END= /DNA_ORIENTATION=